MATDNRIANEQESRRDMQGYRTRAGLAFAVATLLTAAPAAGQDEPSVQASGAIEGVALVIGNEAYTNLPVVGGATADAAGVSVYLRQAGFDVLQYVNLTQGEMLAASQRFIGKLQQNQVAIVYFSGHVLQLNGSNFLMPVNARIDRPTSLLSAGLPLNTLIRRIDLAEMDSAIYFLEGGLAVDPTGDGALDIGMAEPPVTRTPSAFALAVVPNATIAVADPTLGDFTAEILEQATRPGESLRDAMASARDAMAIARGDAPPPWIRDSLDEPFMMAPLAEPLAIDASEQRIWDTIQQQIDGPDRVTALAFYLQLYPDGAYAAEAQRLWAETEAQEPGTIEDSPLDGTGSAEQGDATAEAPDQSQTAGGSEDSATSGTGEESTTDTADSTDTNAEANDEPVADGPEPANQPPVFDAPEAIVLTGQTAMDLILPEPTDPDGDALSVQIVGLPDSIAAAINHAELAIGDSFAASDLSNMTLTPREGAVSGDSLTLEVSDPSGESVTATVLIRILTRENRPPVAFDLALVSIAADAEPLSLNIPPPSDPDGDPLGIIVSALPKFGQVRVGETAVSLDQELTLDDLAGLTYSPNPGQSGDAGALSLSVSDTYGGTVNFSQPVLVTPAPTEAGLTAWVAPQAETGDLRLAQRALQALDLYSGTLDGIFGRGSRAALQRYQATLDATQDGELTLRQRAELAVAGAEAVADAAREIAAQAEEAAAKAQDLAQSDDAMEVSWAAGIYRGEVNGTTLEGYGVLQGSNGQSFAGLFENNEPKLGVHLFQTSSRYAGQEGNREPQGLGVFEYPSGVVFAGEWIGGQINGLGVSQAALDQDTGSVTVAGEWVANTPSGYSAVSDDQNGRRIGKMDAGRFVEVY